VVTIVKSCSTAWLEGIGKIDKGKEHKEEQTKDKKRKKFKKRN